MKRIAVTGGRDYADRDHVWRSLDAVLEKHPDIVLVHGAACGADTLAAKWAADRGVPVEAYPADWQAHGRAAGPRRNGEMVALGLHGLVAFAGGRGTASMVEQCRRAGVAVWMR